MLVSALSLLVHPLLRFLFFPVGVVFVGPLLSVKGLSMTRPLADGLCVFRSQKFKKKKNSCVSIYSTVDRLQFIIPEVERDQLGFGTQAKRWRPLQAVVAQVQVLQFAQRLRDGNEGR